MTLTMVIFFFFFFCPDNGTVIGYCCLVSSTSVLIHPIKISRRDSILGTRVKPLIFCSHQRGLEPIFSFVLTFYFEVGHVPLYQLEM